MNLRPYDVPRFLMACAVAITVLHTGTLLFSACTPPAQTADQSITASAYQAQLDACVLKAKAEDGGRAEADACMCEVASRYGRADSGILNCVGGK